MRERKLSDLKAETSEVLALLEDLHVQATEDRSHHYVGSVAKRAIELLVEVKHWLE